MLRTLAMSGVGIVLLSSCQTLDEKPEAPMTQLTGVEWVVEDIDGRGIVDSSRATLNFSEEGKVNGRGSCNSYTGPFMLTAAGITIGPGIAATRMACAPALMEQEQRFFDALSAVQTFQITTDGALLLQGPGGKSIKAMKAG